MALFPVRPVPEIPEPDSAEVKEVFAYFGLCAYYSQVLEQGITNLAVGLRLRGVASLSSRDVDELFGVMGKKTMGQLLSAVREHISVSPDLDSALVAALKDRNHIAHRYFVVHDIDFASIAGRSEMIAELRDITRRLQAADRKLEAITDELWESLGLTQEVVEQEFARMQDLARRKDEERLTD
jgi:hypothetical protein